MTLKEEQLQKLRELKKKQDRQVRNYSNLELLEEERKNINKKAGDTELVALKCVTNEQDLRERYETRNHRRGVSRRITAIVLLVFMVLGLCVLAGKMMCDNTQFIVDNGGFLPGFDPAEGTEGLDSPEATLIFLAVMLGITLAIIMFVPAEAFGAVEGGGCITALIIGLLVLVVGSGAVFYNLYLVRTAYVAVPAAAVVLSIIQRILVLKAMDGSVNTKLSRSQLARLNRAAQTDKENAAYNAQAKRDSKAKKLAELRPELDRIDQRIAKVKDDMFTVDMQMRSIGILHTDNFVALSRVLELMETGMATDLAHALRLYDSEEDARRRRKEAAEKRSQEMLAMMRLYDSMNQLRRDQAYRERSQNGERNFYEAEDERDYRDNLKKYRDAQRDYYEN